MASKLNDSSLVALCLFLSAGLFYFGTGFEPLWPLMWLAAIPVLWIAPRLSTGAAFLISAAAFALGGFNIALYMADIVPFYVVVLYAAGPAALFGCSVLLFRNRILHGRLRQAAWIVPAFWVAYEYVYSLISVHGTIGNTGYTQLKFLPILQIASVTGIWGISFSLWLFPATLAALFSIGNTRQKTVLASASFLFLACVFGYGVWRLASTPKDSPTIKVGIIASDDAANLLAGTPDQAQGAFARFNQQIQKMSSQGIQAFVMPEHSGPVTDGTQAQTDAAFGQAAKQAHAFIAIGVDRIEAKVAWNQERLYAPDGSMLATYNKHHLLPHWEDSFKPSTTRTALDVPYGAMCARPDAARASDVSTASGKWGLQICKDMDFPLLSRQYAQDGVALMLVPAWDFTVDAFLHGHIAIMRGVEGGFSILRSAKKGTVYASDDRGRVIAEAPTGFASFANVVATVPVRHDATIYTKFGDWFAWLNLALLAVLFVLPVLRK